jgi:hypothetical protein
MDTEGPKQHYAQSCKTVNRHYLYVGHFEDPNSVPMAKRKSWFGESENSTGAMTYRENGTTFIVRKCCDRHPIEKLLFSFSCRDPYVPIFPSYRSL